MGRNTQKYRYGDLIVEVWRISDVSLYVGRFQCLVRGYGHGNTAPREIYIVDAETNAKASRNALQRYKDEYGKEHK